MSPLKSNKLALAPAPAKPPPIGSVWPLDYDRLQRMQDKKKLIASHARRQDLIEVYGDDPIRFITDFGITYDPRRSGQKIIPFYLFDKQVEFIEWLQESIDERKSGTVLKSRDMGITWCACCFTVWTWLYRNGSSIGWGSRKEMLVDRLADPDSIFQKIRMQINYIPTNILPEGYDEKKHDHFMRIVNPGNSSTITGEAGDNIGRGGRKTIYFLDECAFYERPEKVEGALSENTDVQIDISSPQGIGNVFHRRCAAPDTRLFTMFWRDHPGKDQAWYDKKQKKARDEGLEHVFRQEVDCDFSAAVEGILIPGHLVQAAIDSHIKLGIKISGIRQVGFDPYDGGGDRHAMVARQGILIFHCEHWGDGDTGQATRKVVNYCLDNNIESLVYDSIGIGAGVKSETNRLSKTKQGLALNVWGFVAGSGVDRPERRYAGTGRKNKDMFLNLKAQECWKLRERFINTYDAVVKKEEYDPDQIISLDSKMPFLNDLVTELSQPTRDNNDAGKIFIDKKPKGTRSPNIFDSVVMSKYSRRFYLPKGGLRLNLK